MPDSPTPAGPAGNALVLGGTGWVGRHVCAALARRGYTVLAVARNPPAAAGGPAFRSLDLAAASTGALARLLADTRADVVVNATDAANATDGWDRTDEELQVANVRLAGRLVEAMAAQPRRPCLVHFGTIHEYGPVEAGTSVSETAVPRPVNTYARTRLAGSLTVLDAARSGTVDAVVLRLVNVLGPGPSPASFPGKLLELLREAADRGAASLTVADARRDWLDVRDAAAAVPLAVRPGPGVNGEAFNLGSGTAVHTRDLVALARTAAGLPPHALTERESSVPGLGGDWIRADIRRAAERLGWAPRIGLARSMEDMWEAAVPAPGGAPSAGQPG
ncbi:NAD-dependent epimerase/dehydratase family protein [Streptomyces cyaneofuscatus]|uniref:NAD-dependent epimerase/dehydratase family protein n=1 Tax=Streptomyces cyaneofuscatus TaxID=66883 RepID=UPI00369E042C